MAIIVGWYTEEETISVVCVRLTTLIALFIIIGTAKMKKYTF